MSAQSWSLEPFQKEPAHPERELELAYTVPYEWGNLYVSSSAEKSYDLIPLTADAQPGAVVDRPRIKPVEFDITIVGPNEFYVDGEEVPPRPGALRISRQYNKQGVELKLGFSEDTTGLKQMMQYGLAAMLQIDPDEFEKHLHEVTDSDDIPLEVSLEQQAPQMFVHGLCAVLQDVGSDVMREWGHANTNQQFYKKMIIGGSSALAGTGIVAGIPTLVGDFRWPSLVMSGGYALFQSNTLRMALKGFLNTESQRKGEEAIVAARFAGKVATDVHDSFCRDHFDRVMQEQFDE